MAIQRPVGRRTSGRVSPRLSAYKPGLRIATNASTTALLGNFELAATALFAALLFGEAVGQRQGVLNPA